MASTFFVLAVFAIPSLLILCDAQCPENYNSMAGMCIWMGQRQTWNKSQFACVKDNASLIATSKKDQWDQLTSSDSIPVSQLTGVWYGLHYDNNTDTWSWSDGTKFDPKSDWAPWYTGQPNTKAGQCVVIKIDPKQDNKPCWSMTSCDQVMMGVCIKSQQTTYGTGTPFTFPSFPNVTCPPGLSAFAGNCMKYSSDPLVYDDAMASCAANNSYVLFTKDPGMWGYAEYALGSQLTSFWIGIKYDKDKEKFIYSNGDIYDSKTDWAPWKSDMPGTVDSRLGDCVGVQQNADNGKYEWTSKDCNDGLSGVCLYNMPTTPTMPNTTPTITTTTTPIPTTIATTKTTTTAAAPTTAATTPPSTAAPAVVATVAPAPAPPPPTVAPVPTVAQAAPPPPPPPAAAPPSPTTPAPTVVPPSTAAPIPTVAPVAAVGKPQVDSLAVVPVAAAANPATQASTASTAGASTMSTAGASPSSQGAASSSTISAAAVSSATNASSGASSATSPMSASNASVSSIASATNGASSASSISSLNVSATAPSTAANATGRNGSWHHFTGTGSWLHTGTGSWMHHNRSIMTSGSVPSVAASVSAASVSVSALVSASSASSVASVSVNGSSPSIAAMTGSSLSPQNTLPPACYRVGRFLPAPDYGRMAFLPFNNGTATDSTECGRWCLSNSSCESFDYNKGTRECRMFAYSFAEDCMQFIRDANFQHFDLISTDVV